MRTFRNWISGDGPVPVPSPSRKTSFRLSLPDAIFLRKTWGEASRTLDKTI